MARFEGISLKNKIFFSTLAVILLISVAIALFTRWILISSLTSELKLRGTGIAQNIADISRGFILTEDKPELTRLVFDARLGERKYLIAYVFILDEQNHILAHTFTDAFPEELHTVNRISADQLSSIELFRLGKHAIYDVAVLVKEGIYEIGTVRVGLKKEHIDTLIGKLRITFIGFVSAVTLLFFGISNWLSHLITRPISKLIRISDEFSRGNFDFKLDFGRETGCWEVKNCQKEDCPAFGQTDIPCWYVDETKGDMGDPIRFPKKLEKCYVCHVYKKGVRDEFRQLADSFVNMTNRIKISQNKLRESEGKYRSLFTSGPNPIFVLDRETLEILDANPRAENTYGYMKAELTGRHFIDLFQSDGEKEALTFPKTDDGDHTFLIYSKVRLYKKGNIPFYVNIHARPAPYQERDALIIATTDITEIIEKDTQLIQASKMTTLGEMSAGIAHEVNQPLNAIKMGSEFLKMMLDQGRKIPDEDLFHVVNEVSGQVDRASEIINRLREFSRKAHFARERVNINQPIQSVLEITEKQLRLQNITIEADIEETVPAILAHNNRLEQVIFNLVTNARDAINQKQGNGDEPDDRVIRIRSFIEGDRVAVAVSDTGIGIPDSAQKRIFEAFFTTKQMGEGMGLGLSITDGIVSDYGGDIDVESEEGKGTTFKLTFPSAG